ncbi:MAG: hypothetical protein ACHQK9_00160 [Reyranellales bacterium]
MDFIERIFGVSPDGGSGSFEFMILAIPAVALFVAYRVWSRRRTR